MRCALEQQEKDIVTRFFEETVEAINARYQRKALRTTAEFDRFKKRTMQEHDNPIYAKLFTILSDIIK